MFEIGDIPSRNGRAMKTSDSGDLPVGMFDRQSGGTPHEDDSGVFWRGVAVERENARTQIVQEVERFTRDLVPSSSVRHEFDAGQKLGFGHGGGRNFKRILHREP